MMRMFFFVVVVLLIFNGTNCDIEYPNEEYCPVVKICRTPLLYNVKFRCAVDKGCPPGYKCCRSDCYIHKVCVVAVNKNGEKFPLPNTTEYTTTEVFSEFSTDNVTENEKVTTTDVINSNSEDWNETITTTTVVSTNVQELTDINTSSDFSYNTITSTVSTDSTSPYITDNYSTITYPETTEFTYPSTYITTTAETYTTENTTHFETTESSTPISTKFTSTTDKVNIEGSGNFFTDDDEYTSNMPVASSSNVMVTTYNGNDRLEGSGSEIDTEDYIIFPDDDRFTTLINTIEKEKKTTSQLTSTDNDFAFETYSSTFADNTTESAEIVHNSRNDTELVDIDEEITTYISTVMNNTSTTENIDLVEIEYSGDDTELEDIDEEITTYSSAVIYDSSTTENADYVQIEGSGDDQTDDESGDDDFISSTQSDTFFPSTVELDTNHNLNKIDVCNFSSVFPKMMTTEFPEISNTEDDSIERLGTFYIGATSRSFTDVDYYTSNDDVNVSTDVAYSDEIDIDVTNTTHKKMITTDASQISTIEGSGSELTDTEQGDVDEEITTYFSISDDFEQRTSVKDKLSLKFTTPFPDELVITVTEDEDEEEEDDDSDEVDEEIRNNFQGRMAKG